jgi:hypothetical protein
MYVAFKPMHLVFYECKSFKMHLDADQTLPRFSIFFWNLFSFLWILFYLLEGSKILFMSSKYFIWIVYAPIYLWEFFWNFWDFQNNFS